MESNTEDMIWARLINEGDEIAFKHLFYKYSASLRQFAETIVRNYDDAEDLVLDLFSSIWENREQWKIQLTVRAYLFYAIRNNALTFVRNKKEWVGLEHVFDVSGADTSSMLEVDELSKLIEEAVSLLPEKCHEIFERSRQLGQNNREIAQAMGIAEKTVENQITIALRKIKNYLGDGYAYLW